MNQLQTWLQSSQDPTQVANKVKGVILLCSSIIILIAAQLFHIRLGAQDVVSLATEVGGVAGAIWTIYGAVLHIITWIGSVRQPATPTNLPTA